MQIEGKVVLITGASEGIGAACARAFQRRGAKLSLNALPGSELDQFGSRPVVTHGDITNGDVRRRLVARTLENLGAIDILINNAGVGLYLPAWQAPLDLARQLFELNVFAALEMAQLVVPHMQRQNRGVIVNIGSVVGRVTLPWSTIYCASKHALHSLSDGLRRELKPWGIHVMTVIAGVVDTKFREHALAGTAPKRVADIRRVISSEGLATAVVKGVERNSRVVVKPWIGRIFVAVDAIFPRIMDAYLARKW